MDDHGISRRKLLIRGGAVAGTAWAIPIVTTLNQPAGAGAAPSGCIPQTFLVKWRPRSGECTCRDRVKDGWWQVVDTHDRSALIAVSTPESRAFASSWGDHWGHGCPDLACDDDDVSYGDLQCLACLAPGARTTPGTYSCTSNGGVKMVSFEVPAQLEPFTVNAWRVKVFAYSGGGCDGGTISESFTPEGVRILTFTASYGREIEYIELCVSLCLADCDTYRVAMITEADLLPAAPEGIGATTPDGVEATGDTTTTTSEATTTTTGSTTAPETTTTTLPPETTTTTEAPEVDPTTTTTGSTTTTGEAGTDE
jgi:hypothetical protein